MKKYLFPKLALVGIKKNKQLYFPYIITCICMIMMNYVVRYLADSETLSAVRGGKNVVATLFLGAWVIGIFSVIFLFYTNTFLMKRRKMEFGLYNILGMNKRNIAHILFWEMLICAFMTLAAGLFAGILLSKFGELILIKIIGAKTTFDLNISMVSVLYTIIVYLIIYALIYLNNIRQIHFINPIDLLHSASAGEKPPKGNILFGLAGVIILGIAYYIAATVEEPGAAITMFFVAVIMVIVATYLLFIVGSVIMCHILQKNKKYYYKANHFVSVSSMSYRMKRNGAGLASICILSTMVLVIISSTVSLYCGIDDVIDRCYPRDVCINLNTYVSEDGTYINNKKVDSLNKEIIKKLEDMGVEPENVLSFRCKSFCGIENDGVYVCDSSVFDYTPENYEKIRDICLVPLEDYNRITGDNIKLKSNEAIVSIYKAEYNEANIKLNLNGNSVNYNIVKNVKGFLDYPDAVLSIVPTIYVVIDDYEKTLLSCNNSGNAFYYNFDCGAVTSDAAANNLHSKISEYISEVIDNKFGKKPNALWYSVTLREDEWMENIGLYGGLLFLGVLLSIVFVGAAIIIIYYKQVSEGYEDEQRFDIMKKIGMTKQEIKRCINSQLFTVFFAPLIMAGVHLLAAFRMISKILNAMGLADIRVFIITTIITYGIFSVIYICTYVITSKIYYRIVNRK